MPRYTIFQLAEQRVDRFRAASPKAGPTGLRPDHYEPAGQVRADSPYEAWKLLQEEGAGEGAGRNRPLGVGDVLQDDDGAVLVCNYWGFDEAYWVEASVAIAD